MNNPRVTRALALDVALVLGVALVGLLEVSDGSGIEGPRWANAVLVFFVSVPLLWRRHRPNLVMGIIAAVIIGALVIFYLDADQPPLAPFLSLLIAFFSTALYGDDRRTPLVLVISLCALVSEEVLAISRGRYWGDVVPALIFYGVAIVIGRSLRAHHRHAIAAEKRALEVEARRDADARQAVEDERSRIARELHDVIAHNLSVIVVQAAAERRTLDDHQTSTRETLETIEETARGALVELRRLLGIVRKGSADMELRPQPGFEDVGELVHQVREAGVRVDMRVEGGPLNLPASLGLTVYRIIQEALTNVIKHAPEASTEVVVRCYSDAIEVDVSDGGNGAAPVEGTGHGLIGMRERVAMFGGSLQAGPRPGGGFHVEARLPLIGGDQ